MSRGIPPLNERINSVYPFHRAGRSKAGEGVEAELQMNDEHAKRDRMSLEEATVSSMWEIATALKVPVAELCNDKAV